MYGHIAEPELNLITRHITQRHALLEAYCPPLKLLRALVNKYDSNTRFSLNLRIEALLCTKDQSAAPANKI
jgi:hypothetical protein